MAYPTHRPRITAGIAVGSFADAHPKRPGPLAGTPPPVAARRRRGHLQAAAGQLGRNPAVVRTGAGPPVGSAPRANASPVAAQARQSRGPGRHGSRHKTYRHAPLDPAGPVIRRPGTTPRHLLAGRSSKTCAATHLLPDLPAGSPPPARRLPGTRGRQVAQLRLLDWLPRARLAATCAPRRHVRTSPPRARLAATCAPGGSAARHSRTRHSPTRRVPAKRALRRSSRTPRSPGAA